MFRKTYNVDDEDDDDVNEEEKGFSESLSEIERSISLCTLCDAETKTSQRSSFFVPSLPLVDESSDSYSFKNAIMNFASPYLQSEAFPLFFVSGTTPVVATTLDNQDDDHVPYSLFRGTRKPRESGDEYQLEDVWKKTKQQLSADAVERDVSMMIHAESILGDIDDYYNNDFCEPAKTPKSPERDEFDAQRPNGKEQKLYANDKDSVGNLDELSDEVPRDYRSDIFDDEIPKKRAKVSQDRPAEPPSERKRVGGGQPVSPTTGKEPIPCKRSKIVNIEVLNTPNKVSFSNIHESMPQDCPQTAPTTETRPISAPVGEDEPSIVHSQEVPLASELKLLQFTAFTADLSNAVPQVSASADNGLAPSEKLANGQNPEAEQARRSEKQRANAGASDGSSSKRPKIGKEQLSGPVNSVDNVAAAVKQRRLSDTWSEIESTFATSREKKPLICRKSKPVTSIASSAPSVKRLRTRITKQRNSLTSTLTKLQNLSSYMDQIRDAILAEDDNEKEYTVVKKSGAAAGPTTKIMVSTGTQTLDLPDSHPPAPPLAAAASSITVSTQTEPAASNLSIEPADATRKSEPEVERSTFAKKPNRKTPNKRRPPTIDTAAARAHDAILNATFEEFRSKKRD